MPKSPITQVNEYAAAVRSGALPSCLMVRKAVDRWYSDWGRMGKDGDLYFDYKATKLIAVFVEGDKDAGWGGLKHFKGEWAGQTIRLEPWEWFVVLSVFGIKYKKTKKRKYKYADVYVPRKNGKTTLAAVIALVLLMIDGENAAEVYSFAVDKEQAKICFDASVQIATASGLVPGEAQYYKHASSLVVEGTASAYKPLSKDTKNKDGLNPHGAIGDEAHAWKTFEITEVIQTGMGARKQPLLFQISTAGTDTTYPYFKHLEYLRQILLGVVEDDTQFALLYEPDEGDDWSSEDTWKKVNPNYGVSLSVEYMEDSYKKAKQKGGSTLAAFQTKNLNMWVDAPEVWIPDDDVAACSAPVNDEDLAGADCYVGIDLASKGDITAAAFWFPKFGVVRYLFTVPESKITENQARGDVVDYRLWVEQGYLTVCPGRVLDEEWWLELLFNEMAPYKIKCIAFDPWGMWDLKNRFGKYEDVLLEYPQGIRYMSVPTKDLESRVLKHNINLCGNPVIRWMFRNVVIYRDPNANIKLDKARSRNKIDGVVATVDAIGGWLNKTTEDDSHEIYTDMKFHTAPRL